MSRSRESSKTWTVRCDRVGRRSGLLSTSDGWGSSARRRRPSGASPIRAAVAARNPDAEIKFVDTVCLPTKEHQRALERLLERVEAVVVVGGQNSNNTRELVARCRERGKPGAARPEPPPSSTRPGSRGSPRSA